MKTVIYSSFLLVLAIVCGCQKTNDLTYEMPVSFSASLQERTPSEGVGTKGTLLNETGSNKSLSDYTDKFYISAWNEANGSSAIPTGTEVLYINNDWHTSTTYYWTENVQKTFFAVANLPAAGGGGVLCNSKAYMSLSLNVSESADKQSDILLGSYTGYSDKGCADIHFIHPLVSVAFKEGVLAGGVSVIKLSLVKVASSGNVKIYPDGSLSEWSVNKYENSVTQSDESGLSNVGGCLGEPFILIPQNLTDHPVKVVLELSDGNVVTTSLSSGVWEYGKTYIYTLDYDNPE